MAQAVINPRIRGFLCLTSHPSGCAAQVARQIALARAGGPGHGLGRVLVVGGSAGFGLSSLITTVWGYGAQALAVAFERGGNGEKPGSAGWYNLAAVQRAAAAEGRTVKTLIGDAFSAPVLDAAVAAIRAMGPLDAVVYSLAAPKRKDPAGDTVWSSVLKPIGAPYTSQTVDLDTDQVKPITIAPASPEEIAATTRVMGGDDWRRWTERLLAEGLLAPGCRTVAYSYIGPQITHAIYRAGTIGAAKDHLEATGRALDTVLKQRLGPAAGAWVSVNKALVTQASSAIPVVPLYISLLFRVMRAKGCHEGTIEQMVRLWKNHLAPGRTPAVDDAGRIRVDDWEMRPDVQAAVAEAWTRVRTENLGDVSDYALFRRDFRQLFGFEVDGIDYAAPVEVEAPLT
jgi:enoyl-[acyl-carrier protein] reductase / trans-2-enoyl-CoA reductase (NAD+)